MGTHFSTGCRPRAAVLLLGLALAAPGRAAPSTSLMEMSLEELLSISVTSVSRKAERAFEAAAAVHVITGDDIRRSGATSIPESLRLAPGVQVARINANEWAVSIRGFNGGFANKLLVLIDGRTVYSPLFSGVFWDMQDVVLEDIDRIEVIRGPGATLWGANAVNGIINIITKPSAETEGTLASVLGGTEDRLITTLRHGGRLSDDASYRVWGKFFERDSSELASTGVQGSDDWRQQRAGFRVDWRPREADALTFQGDVYDGTSGKLTSLPVPAAPFVTNLRSDAEVFGANLMGKWQHTISPDSEISLQAYFDYTDRESVRIDEQRRTFDLEFQHRFPLLTRHELTWGVRYRYTSDDTSPTLIASLTPDERTDDLFSAFVQSELSLWPDRLKLILGSKFEENDYTDVEVQPNARVLLTPAEDHVVWASVARAVRTPSRGESDGTVLSDALLPGEPGNPFPIPVAARTRPSRSFEAEEVIAWELGYRVQPNADLRLDFAAFYNEYDDLRFGSPVGLSCQPSGTPVALNPLCFLTEPNVQLAIEIGNTDEAASFGIEASADWQPLKRLRFQGHYGFMNVNQETRATNAAIDVEGTSPHHQLSLRSLFDVSPAVELDFWVRYVDELEAFGIDDYVTLDARLAWRPRPGVELSLVGQNLVEDTHREYETELGVLSPPSAIERSGYVQLRLDF